VWARAADAASINATTTIPARVSMSRLPGLFPGG
jgi:hypothetical protein